MACLSSRRVDGWRSSQKTFSRRVFRKREIESNIYKRKRNHQWWRRKHWEGVVAVAWKCVPSQCRPEMGYDIFWGGVGKWCGGFRVYTMRTFWAEHPNRFDPEIDHRWLTTVEFSSPPTCQIRSRATWRHTLRCTDFIAKQPRYTIFPSR